MRLVFFVFALSFVICGTVPELATSCAADWPQWRGPNRDCRVDSTPAWPEVLIGKSLKRSRMEKLGPSYSGPIIAGDFVFVTETVDAKTEVVRAFDRKSGNQVWRAEWPGALSVPFFAKSNGDWIRATPCFDGKRLYVAGIRDVLVCLDAQTGKVLWRVDFVKTLKSPLPSFGFVSSPLVEDDAIFVQAGAGVACLEKHTGKIRWHTLKDGGGMFGSAFASPVIATIHGIKQLVVQTRSKLSGVDLKTGKPLWSVDVPAFRGMNILTPMVIGNRIFTSSYGGGSFLFEIRRSDASVWSVAKVWTSKVQGYMSSPVVVGDFLYLHLRNQRFTCLSLKSGEIKWTTTPYGKYWSMAVQKDRILALDERGELLLIHANPEKFDLIGRLKVSENPTWAHIAITGNEIYVRDLKGLTRFDWIPTKLASTEN